MTVSAADRALYALMSSASERVLEPGSDTYDIGMETMGDALREPCGEAHHADLVYVLWAELTDIDDDPRIGARRLARELTRLAAREWLQVEAARSGGVADYFRRWADPMMLTRELFTVGGEGGWRTEYYSYLEREVLHVLQAHHDRLPPAESESAAEYVAAGEYGLGLEQLTHALSEYEPPITAREADRLRWLARLMSSERAQQDLDEVRVVEQ